MSIKLNEGKIFYFPKFNKKNYYILFFALCSLFRRLFPYIIEYFPFGELDKKNFNKSCAFDMISNFTNDIITGFYKLYSFYKIKKKKLTGDELIEKFNRNTDEGGDESLSKKKLILEKQKIDEGIEMKKKFFYIMGIIAIVDIIAQLCLFVYSYIDTDGCSLGFSEGCNNNMPKLNEDDLLFTVAINIIFKYIFSRLFLTLYIYFHHFVSILITLVSFIPLIILNIISISNGQKSDELNIYMTLNIVMCILYSLEDVLNKIALNKLIIRPYEIMFYKSLFQIPLFFITFLIVCLVDKYHPNKDSISFWDYLNENSSKLASRFLYRISFILPNIFRTLSLIIVTEVLTPNHLSILKSLEFAFLSIFSMSKNIISKPKDGNNAYFYIIELICCIIMLFASCIHNEIFIINRCNLSKSTDYYKGFIPDNKIDEEISKYEKINKEMKEEDNNTSYKAERHPSEALLEIGLLTDSYDQKENKL